MKSIYVFVAFCFLIFLFINEVGTSSPKRPPPLCTRIIRPIHLMNVDQIRNLTQSDINTYFNNQNGFAGYDDDDEPIYEHRIGRWVRLLTLEQMLAFTESQIAGMTEEQRIPFLDRRQHLLRQLVMGLGPNINIEELHAEQIPAISIEQLLSMTNDQLEDLRNRYNASLTPFQLLLIKFRLSTISDIQNMNIEELCQLNTRIIDYLTLTQIQALVQNVNYEALDDKVKQKIIDRLNNKSKNKKVVCE